MKKYWLWGALIVIVFLGLRLPALHLPYFQDEWKAVSSVAQGASEAGSMFAHPPLTALSFRLDAALFGLNSMRMLPLVFACIAGILLYVAVMRRSGASTGLIAVGLYAVAFYSILASLMVDTDGAILPTFFLLAVYAYDGASAAVGLPAQAGKSRRYWWALFALALIVGMMVKLSFIIVIGVFVVDFILVHKKAITKKKALQAVAALCGLVVFIAIIFLGLRFLYPQFSMSAMIDHARSFIGLSGRSYSQILFETMKAILYLSPLLILPVAFIRRETFEKTRLYWLYLGLGFIFYYILFDFSRGALDKYLMFTIVPMCVISATVIGDVFTRARSAVPAPRRRVIAIVSGIVISLALFLTQFVNNVVPSLYPKSEWLSRVIHLQWNMLMPFNGGSGPMGFYVSFMFIALTFLVSIVITAAAVWKPSWRPTALIILICMGVTYHLAFAEEYARGKINGKAADVLAPLITYARNDSSTDQYITYNDTGAYELSTMSKYAGRFYAVPELQDFHLNTFKSFTGKYLIVNVPRIDPSSGYAAFFRACTVLATSTSGVMQGNIYSCHQPQ